MAQTKSNPDKTHYDFDRVATGYDRCNHLFSLGVDHLWRRWVVRRLCPRAGQRLLDICCGTGDLVFSFFRHSPVKDAVGLDVSESMIMLACRKQQRLFERRWMKDRKVDWLLADAAAVPLPDGSFDLITCAFGIRNITSRAAALREVTRLLKPGGRVCFLEFSLPRSKLPGALYWFYLSRIMPLGGAILLGSPAPLHYLAGSIQRWHTQVDFAAELAQAGLAFETKVPLTAGIVTAWLAQKYISHQDTKTQS